MKPIFIGAGHSNTDPGATNGVLTEAHIVTDFRNIVAFYLREAGVPFITDGTGNQNASLREAIGLVEQSCVAVEFHCNSFTNPQASGTETLSQEKDKALGRELTSVVAHTLFILDRGAKSEGSGQHSRLGFVRAGGIILELFFLSNPADLQAYLDKKWLIAKGVAKVLINAQSARQ